MYRDNIGNFIRFVFLENDCDAKADISLHGLNTTKQLFMFCFDMLCAGLLIFHANESGELCLEDITAEDFGIIKKKMENVGIRVLFERIDLPEKLDLPAAILDLNTQNNLNMQALMAEDENLPDLKDYVFELQTLEYILKIRFEVFHAVPDPPKNMVL